MSILLINLLIDQRRVGLTIFRNRNKQISPKNAPDDMDSWAAKTINA